MTQPSDDAVPPVGGDPVDSASEEAVHGRHAADEDPGAGNAPARTAAGTDELVAALDVLRGELTAQRLPLVTPGVEEDRRTLALAVDQLDDYLLPRLRSRSAPLLV
ncbi:ABC transporter, partial [Actinotalea fermentans ATCC 43279 = JCM 9966 = DSM 3133]